MGPLQNPPILGLRDFQIGEQGCQECGIPREGTEAQHPFPRQLFLLADPCVSFVIYLQKQIK
jgi:hypothetical protein